MRKSSSKMSFRHVKQLASHSFAAQKRWYSSSGPSTVTALDSILIANRGEIAIRINRTASKHGIRTATVYTDPDAHSQHAHSSPWSFNLGSAAAYLDQDKILALAAKHKCKAIHPGYGFLSENADFARKCAEKGLVFIGPPSSAIEDMGDKARSKEIMNAANVPCVPGYHGTDQSLSKLTEEARKIGFPVLIKAVRGGGGKGMRIVRSETDFEDMLTSAKRESMSSFGNDEVLVEKYITTPRHIEVQVFADKHGNCIALGERDCSIQRRHQKILEESPAPNLEDDIRKDLWGKARAAALAVRYEGAGTVEFIFDNDNGKFYFMEMNTRLQVEHPVTEMVTGQDLVYWQILVAEGRALPLTQEEVEQQIAARGHAIEARIYAENPDKGFLPDSGQLLHVKTPPESEDVRIDSGFVQGDQISSHYDPMIAKLIVRGCSREDAVLKLCAALEQYEIAGPVTNIDFLKRICRSSDFMKGDVETGYIPKHQSELFPARTITDEALVEAALATMLAQGENPAAESRTMAETSPSWLLTQQDFQPRNLQFQSADEESTPGSVPKIYSVSVRQLAPTQYSIVTSSGTFKVNATYDQSLGTITTYFPHTRHTTRAIISPHDPLNPAPTSIIHIFGPQGSFRIQPAIPPWLRKALGTTEKINSLVSPMPCKILRVDVKPGDVVKKDQMLLVIESMKMETVIRSPGDKLTVKKVLRGTGEVVGAGVELVEFEPVLEA